VQVEDGTTSPEYTFSKTDVTVCFDVKDGFVRVDVPDFSRVDVEWIDDSNNVISRQFFADSLDAGSYILRLTDVITGCVSTEVINIENKAITPDDPTVFVNRNRTNCTSPNGSAVANVDGVQMGYLFEWFDQNNMTTPYTTGAEVFNLDTATYLIKATNLATGCESALSSITIEYEITDPVFEVVYSVAACLRTEDGSTNQFDGTAIVGFEEFNAVTNYRWEDADGNVVGSNSRLIDVGPGVYTVYFTADNGCDYSVTFNMSTELMVYNGLSANDDGMNDFFLIDCIDQFANNNVKIFNRDGVRVFEIDSYDNRDRRFNGTGNLGRNQVLPTGTYFYIIDKGDGSAPMQGYVELVR
jgi:gliding motility-associated-like protein